MLLKIKELSIQKLNLPESCIVCKFTTARIADLFNSSIFSNSCFTEFALIFNMHVCFKGSTILSNPKIK